MKKFKIKPRIITLTDDNYLETEEKIEKEILMYDIKVVGKGKYNKKYTLCPSCFDTETTTFDQKAYVYMFQIQIGKYCILARKKELMFKLLHEVNEFMENLDAYLTIGIANIKYEWSFLGLDFQEIGDYHDVLYLEHFDPLYAICGKLKIVDIIKMTNCNLAKIGKDYCSTQKLVGDLDYSIIRNSLTPMNHTEIMYCVNDVVVGAEFIAAMHDEWTCKGESMPLTSTAVVRKIMHDEADRKVQIKTGKIKKKKLKNGEIKEKEEIKNVKYYKDILDKVHAGFPKSYESYSHIMNNLFRGGYTHGNLYYAGELLKNIEHIDFTSDYPARMLQKKYPTVFYKKIKIGKKTLNSADYESKEGLDKLVTKKDKIAFWCEATFKNIKSKHGHSLESLNKILKDTNGNLLLKCDEDDIDNGRILNAEEITVLITDLDYDNYLKTYTFDDVIVKNLELSIKEPLPWYVVKAVVENYAAKKILKDAGLPNGHEKKILNSTYGCTVQGMIIGACVDKLVKDEIQHFNYEFPTEYLDIDDEDAANKNNLWVTYIADYCKREYGYGKDPIKRSNLIEMIKWMYVQILNGKKFFNNEKRQNVYKAIVYKLKQRKYNEEVKDKILSPWWGIYVTAYARNELITIIDRLETYAEENFLEPIVVYYDTDSLFMNSNQNEECAKECTKIIDDYNKEIMAENALLRDNHPNIEKLDLFEDIGTFSYEPLALTFKELGAKRYLQHYEVTEKITKKVNGKEVIVKRKTQKIECTVSGLNKADFNKKLKKIGKTVKDKFDFFDEGMCFDAMETSKLTPTYSCRPYSGVVTDAYGNSEVMSERSGQCLDRTEFSMQLLGLIAKTVRGRKDTEIE